MTLFTSLHADALSDQAVRGASVYTLSLEPSERQSDELARQENSVNSTAMQDCQKYSPDVANILATRAERETRHFLLTSKWH